MRKVIQQSGVSHSVINGRDLFESSRIKNQEGEIEIRYPLRWMKPSIRGGITFGSGSDSFGRIPLNSNSVFPFSTRVCLVETNTPNVEYSMVESGGYYLQLVSVKGVDCESTITEIPSPYLSVIAILRYPSASSPETLMTMLGYADPVNGLAIGERLRYTKPANPDILTVNRYPYIIPALDSSMSGYSLTADADEYYYNEEDLQAAEDALP